MDGMRLLLSILFLILDDSDAAITIEGGSNFSAFKEENVTIPWEYDFENETFSLQWSFTNASSYTSTVMNKLGSSPAVVVGDFNIKHNSGGKITLTEVQLSNTGTYSCLVTYNPLSGHTQVTGTAVLTVSVKTTTTTTTTPAAPTTTTTMPPTTTTSVTTTAMATSAMSTSTTMPPSTNTISETTTPTKPTTTTKTETSLSAKTTSSTTKTISSATTSGISSTGNNKTSSRDETVVIIGVSSAVGLIVIVIVIILVLVFWEKQKKRRHHQGYSKDYQSSRLSKGCDDTYFGLKNNAKTSHRNTYIGQLKANPLYVGDAADQSHRSEYYRVQPRFLPYGKYLYTAHHTYPAHSSGNDYINQYRRGSRRTAVHHSSCYPDYMKKHNHSSYSSGWSARRPLDDRDTAAAADYSVYSMNWR